MNAGVVDNETTYCTDCERGGLTLGPTGQCHECWQEDQERRLAEDYDAQ